MKKIILSVFSLLALFSIGACGNAKQKTDEKKESNSSQAVKFKSVIAGTETIAEYLDALNISIVGVSKQDNIPKRYSKVERVGAPRQLNMEKIVSLKPDLFLGDNALKEMSSAEMTKHKIESVYLDSSSYDNVLNSLNQLGKLFNREGDATKVVKGIEQKEQKAMEGSEKLKGKKVALLFGTGGSYMLATEKSYIGSLINKLGVENVASKVSKAPSPYVKFSLENVVAENPDYILTLAHGHKEQAAKAFEQELKKDLWKETTAVKKGHTYPLDDKEFPVTGNIHVADTTKALKALLLKGLNN